MGYGLWVLGRNWLNGVLVEWLSSVLVYWCIGYLLLINSVSASTACQTTIQISPLHSVPVEMTMFSVTSSEVERSLLQTTPEISRLHSVPLEMFRVKSQAFFPSKVNFFS